MSSDLERHLTIKSFESWVPITTLEIKPDIIEISAKTGDGIPKLIKWIKSKKE